ncbi:nicotinate-nucleotide adenylyltransferase [Legionella birminghamensis]|uniref:nicotinate-nucleotide adenylyltransferase n=1 Tax=Legionella birminghamensis TaxID=28083 RepID=UPI000730FCA7|nr:nicotinate-nucleotide adenylyltransferase [Legionella birminghamensis]
MDNLLIFGGTFDPIHQGHLNVAENIQKHFRFQRFIFLPCKLPVHKEKATANSTQRIEMLKLALADYPGCRFEIDDCEIRRQSPSYMVTTLESYRKDLGMDISITLLMGMDSFYQLPLWHRWTRILELANLLVIKRPDISLPVEDNVLETLSGHVTDREEDLKNNAQGIIYFFDAGSYPISSTEIRRNSLQNSEAIPEAVLMYITENKLYS